MQKLLEFRMTIAEWIGLGLILGVAYVALGGVWSMANADRFHDLHGGQLVKALVGAVLAWPVLLLPDICVS